eukprot:UN02924
MIRRQFKALGIKKYLPFQSFWGINNDIDMAHIPLSYALQFKPDLHDIINSNERELIPFTTVRNPYDRIWSSFQFEKTANWIPQNPLYYDTNLDINTFIKHNLQLIIDDQNERFEKKHNLSLCGIHFIQQTLMMKCTGNDGLSVEKDNILRQENIEHEFPEFMYKTGALEDENEYNDFFNDLKPANCSNLSQPPKMHAYAQYYNAKSIEIVNDLFKEDFDAFDYSKIDPATPG